MKSLAKWIACLAAILPAAALAAPVKRPGPHAAAHPVAAAHDWLQVAGATPEGGARLGNPAAKVKLVEFLSFTCPHCAAFEAEAVPRLLDKYVRKGLVSYEVRLALRDPFDMTAALLARCDGPQRFFVLAPAIYAAQAQWTGKASEWAGSAPDMSNARREDLARALLKGSGLDAIGAAHGLAPARALTCVANEGEQRLLAERAKAIWELPGFPGTPAFLIDGTLKPDIHDWAALDQALGKILR